MLLPAELNRLDVSTLSRFNDELMIRRPLT